MAPLLRRALVALLLAPLAAAAAPQIAARQDVFVPSKATPLYRIPALAALNATHVVALAEARAAHVRIVAKVSDDGGKSWGPEQPIVAEPGQKIGNPAPVVLDAGHVLLVYCRNNRNVLAANLTLGHGGALTVGRPRDITRDALAGMPEVSFVASGPPGGIRSAATGRIVVAMDLVPAKAGEPAAEHLLRGGAGQSSKCRSFIMHSDDVGLSWQHSGALPLAGSFSTSENQVASIDGGTHVITTARTDDFATAPTAHNFRAVAVSSDRGSTFSEFRQTNVPDPTCEGSTIGLGGRYWMSSGVATTPGNRSNVSLSVCDAECVAGGCVEWASVLSVDPGLSSYSSLAATGETTLLLLWEVGGGESITALSLATIELPQPAPRPLPTKTDDHAPEKPHIVYFLVDDLGFSNVGYNNGPHPEPLTPHIDELHATGAELTNYYVYRFCKIVILSRIACCPSR